MNFEEFQACFKFKFYRKRKIYRKMRVLISEKFTNFFIENYKSLEGTKPCKTFSLLHHFGTHTHTRFLQSLISCCAKTQEFHFFSLHKKSNAKIYLKKISKKKVLERMADRKANAYIEIDMVSHCSCQTKLLSISK